MSIGMRTPGRKTTLVVDKIEDLSWLSFLQTEYCFQRDSWKIKHLNQLTCNENSALVQRNISSLIQSPQELAPFHKLLPRMNSGLLTCFISRTIRLNGPTQQLRNEQIKTPISTFDPS